MDPLQGSLNSKRPSHRRPAASSTEASPPAVGHEVALDARGPSFGEGDGRLVVPTPCPTCAAPSLVPAIPFHPLSLALSFLPLLPSRRRPQSLSFTPSSGVLPPPSGALGSKRQAPPECRRGTGAQPVLVFQTRACCAGFFGPQCQACPGRAQSVCSGNGICLDGANGTGVCECGQGFSGTACETCVEGKYGIHCDQGAHPPPSQAPAARTSQQQARR